MRARMVRQINFYFFRNLWRLKTSMQENQTRYWVYLWISIWKIVLFFVSMIAVSAEFYSGPQVGGRNRAAYLFDDFEFSGIGYKRLELKQIQCIINQ